MVKSVRTGIKAPVQRLTSKRFRGLPSGTRSRQSPIALDTIGGGVVPGVTMIKQGVDPLPPGRDKLCATGPSAGLAFHFTKSLEDMRSFSKVPKARTTTRKIKSFQPLDRK